MYGNILNGLKGWTTPETCQNDNEWVRNLVRKSE